MAEKTTRRDFVKTSVAAAGAAAIYHTNVHARILGANDRVNIGCIGIGGRGSHDMQWAIDTGKKSSSAQVVAVCDVYRKRLNKAKEVSQAELATLDYREVIARKELEDLPRPIRSTIGGAVSRPGRLGRAEGHR